MINVLAFDPGLERFGAAIIQTDGAHTNALAVDCFESAPKVASDDVHVCDDDVRRTRECASWLDWFTRGMDIHMVAAESMSWPPSHRSTIMMALVWGVIASFLCDRSLHLEQASPSHLRTALTGQRPTRGGTKAERAARTAARERATHAEVVRVVPTIVPLVRRLPGERQLHVLDAGAAFVWSLSTPKLRSLVR